MKSFSEFCIDNNLRAEWDAIGEADLGRINIGKFLEPVIKRMSALIGTDGMKAVAGVVSGFGKDKVKDYDAAKKDLMSALKSTKLPAGKEWIEGEYVFWAACLARACRENNPSIVAKALG